MLEPAPVRIDFDRDGPLAALRISDLYKVAAHEHRMCPTIPTVEIAFHPASLGIWRPDGKTYASTPSTIIGGRREIARRDGARQR